MYYSATKLQIIVKGFALEDATIENGCLWVLPGGHKGELSCRYERQGENKAVLNMYPQPDWPEDDWIPLEMEKGSMVCFHGYLPHKSLPNRSSKSRHAYAIHVIEGKYDWLPGNWIQRHENPAKGFVV